MALEAAAVVSDVAVVLRAERRDWQLLLLKIAVVGNVAVEPKVRGAAATVDDDVALEPRAQG